MVALTSRLPDRFADERELEDFMTTPTAPLVEDLGAVEGDIVVLGVGGKMGPTLARLARRAAPGKRVTGVARFSEAGLREQLEAAGVECVQADLLDPAQIERLPDAANVVFMAGRKFGSSGREDLTWAMNGFVPGLVAQRYAGSRIVAFSTACVYPFVDVYSGGATEQTPPTPPPGDYANSCVARERIFEYFSNLYGTPGRLIRLSYAIDMRYGVLHDVARAVYRGEPIELAMGHVNVIWQGDANAMVLRALRHCTVPCSPLNVSGPETVSIRALALEFGRRFDRAPVLTGSEASTAWLVNTEEATRLFGYPTVPLARMIDWVADWVARDLRSWNKATHFETREGTY
jgi:nucleoside-diphosphate-sugar epimerase